SRTIVLATDAAALLHQCNVKTTARLIRPRLVAPLDGPRTRERSCTVRLVAGADIQRTPRGSCRHGGHRRDPPDPSHRSTPCLMVGAGEWCQRSRTPTRFTLQAPVREHPDDLGVSAFLGLSLAAVPVASAHAPNTTRSRPARCVPA